MLTRFKKLLNSTNNQIQAIGGATSIPPQKTAEQKIVEGFAAYVNELNQNPNVPKKVILNLNDILNLSREIQFDDMTLDHQSLVRRILEVDVHLMLEVYLSLPKAHAVSVVLENGKTAKDTVIENTRNLYNTINQVYTDAVKVKTELLLKKEKVSKMIERKKDFFDL